MSTVDIYKYVHGETYTAEKIPQPIAGTGFVDVVGPDGITPLAFSAIALFDDALGTTELTIDVDFEVGSEDGRYTELESTSVYRSIRILNAAYQSAVFYVDASVVGGYAVDSETVLTQFKSVDNTFSGSTLFTGATPQVASAWVNFNGTGTVAIRDDYNVDSITDGGTGIYTLNFTTALSNANYAVAGAAKYDNSGNRENTRVGIFRASDALQTGSAKITTGYDTAAQDAETVTVIILGGV